MGPLLQRTLSAQGHLHALFCRSASACRQDDGLCHLSQCPAERQVPVLRKKASDTCSMGIPQAVSQRKARRRHADTPGNPAIPRQPSHLLPLHERAAHPHARAAGGNYRHIPRVRLYRRTKLRQLHRPLCV